MKDLLSTDSKRVFIAIEFQENIKNYLHKIQSIVIKESKTGNFTSKENFHLTLKFIGEVKVHKLEEINKCIDEVALNQSDFKLYFDRLGQFPRESKSIVWVGLKSNEILDKLYLDLEMALEKIGIKREGKKLTPHITIGRQVVFNEEFSKLEQIINTDNMPILVDKISLMETTRVDGKLKYIPIYVNKFNFQRRDKS